MKILASLFSEAPIFAQFFPTIEKSTIFGINRIAQAGALISAIFGIYPDAIRNFVSISANLLSFLIKNILRILGFTWGKNGPAFGIGEDRDTESTYEELFESHNWRGQLLAALTAAPILILVNVISFSWIPSPKELFLKILTLWSGIKIEFLSIFIAIVESIARLILSLLLLAVFITEYFLTFFAWLMIFWAFATLLAAFSKNFSDKIFRAAMALLLLTSGLLVLITT